jgi:hypothetical protein
VVDFNRDLDASVLNLYDLEDGSLGAADVTLVGATVGTVRGSVVIDPSLRRLTFVRTGGLLLPDSYTLTLRSSASGFRDSLSALLDGDANGIAGGDFTQTFLVSPPPVGAVTVRLPHVVRGPQQPVNLPPSGISGIPISFSEGGGIASASIQIWYDPALLNISAATVAPGLPAGASVVLNLSTPGVAEFLFTSPTPLPAGTTRFVDLQASVPASATYRTKHVLDVGSVVLNGGSIPALAADSIHVVAYAGDTSGNGGYSSQDASKIARLAVGLDGGLALYKLLDPFLVADVTANGALSSSDASQMLQAVVGIVTVDIPPLPSPAVSLIQGGPDPKLSIPTDLVATPGGSVNIPVYVDSIVDLTGHGLESADLVVYFDAAVLDVSSVQLGSLVDSSTRPWMMAFNIDPQAGRAIISLAGAPLEGYFQGELVRLVATVKAAAAPGESALNLAAGSHDPARLTQLNEGYLTLIPAPTDGANDADVDGRLTIVPNLVDRLPDRMPAAAQEIAPFPEGDVRWHDVALLQWLSSEIQSPRALKTALPLRGNLARS